MNHPELVRLALVTAITAALPQMVWAAGQDASAPTAQADTQTNTAPAAKKQPTTGLKDTKSLQTVVVTANAGGVKRTMLNDTDVEQSEEGLLRLMVTNIMIIGFRI